MGRHYSAGTVNYLPITGWTIFRTYMALCWYSLSHSDFLYVANAMQSTISVLQCVNFYVCLHYMSKTWLTGIGMFIWQMMLTSKHKWHIEHAYQLSKMSIQNLSKAPNLIPTLANGSNWRKGAPYLACMTLFLSLCVTI